MWLIGSGPAAAHSVNLSDLALTLGSLTIPIAGALHSASSDLSDIGADRPFAGMAFDNMRRLGTKPTLDTLGLKTSLGGSTRTGSRSSPRVSAHPAIIPFLGPRTDPF
jgi:hypothetical protein